MGAVWWCNGMSVLDIDTAIITWWCVCVIVFCSPLDLTLSEVQYGVKITGQFCSKAYEKILSSVCHEDKMCVYLEMYCFVTFYVEHYKCIRTRTYFQMSSDSDGKLINHHCFIVCWDINILYRIIMYTCSDQF